MWNNQSINQSWALTLAICLWLCYSVKRWLFANDSLLLTQLRIGTSLKINVKKAKFSLMVSRTKLISIISSTKENEWIWEAQPFAHFTHEESGNQHFATRTVCVAVMFGLGMSALVNPEQWKKILAQVNFCSRFYTRCFWPTSSFIGGTKFCARTFAAGTAKLARSTCYVDWSSFRQEIYFNYTLSSFTDVDELRYKKCHKDQCLWKDVA